MTCLATFIETVATPYWKKSSTVSEATGPIEHADDRLINDLRSALNAIPADCSYAEWINVGAALKALGDAGRPLFLEWSYLSSRAVDGEPERKWEQLGADRTSHKVVFATAQRHGWTNPGRGAGYGIPGAGSQPFNPFAQGARYKLLSGNDLRNLPPMEWRIKSVLPAQGVAVIFGPSTAGKSFLAFDMLCAIAEGRQFFGLRTNQAPGVYFGLEGQSGVRGRSIAWETVNGRELPIQAILDTHDLKNPYEVAELAKLCPQGSVVVIDTLARAGDDDENDPKQRALVINGAMELQRLTRGLVLLVAHTGKDEDKGLRGHKKLFDALDASISVSRNGNRRWWQATKVKDGEDGTSRHFKLAVIPIGTDRDGDEITSCVIAPEHGTFESTPSKPLTENQIHGMTSYRVAAGKAGNLDSDGNFIGLHIEAWREEFYRSSALENQDTKRKAFNRARADLVSVGELAVDSDFYVVAGPNAVISNGAIAAQILAGTAGHDRDMGGTCPAS